MTETHHLRREKGEEVGVFSGWPFFPDFFRRLGVPGGS